jgi:hypothetical protein
MDEDDFGAFTNDHEKLGVKNEDPNDYMLSQP